MKVPADTSAGPESSTCCVGVLPWCCRLAGHVRASAAHAWQCVCDCICPRGCESLPFADDAEADLECSAFRPSGQPWSDVPIELPHLSVSTKQGNDRSMRPKRPSSRGRGLHSHKAHDAADMPSHDRSTLCTVAPGVATGPRLLAVSNVLPSSLQRDCWRLDGYVLLKALYQGSSSIVYKAKCKCSDEVVVLKIYRLPRLEPHGRQLIVQEAQLHSRLQHPNIVQLFAAFQEGSEVVLVQEHAGRGDLFSRLRSRKGGCLCEAAAVQTVLLPFLHALAYLHARGIAHGDIKPENIVFTDDNTLKLADFGLSTDALADATAAPGGTFEFMAPEIFRWRRDARRGRDQCTRDVQDCVAADVWAVGVVAFEVIVGRSPFAAGTMREIERKIKAAHVIFPSGVSSEAQHFIIQCLSKRPRDRPSVPQLLQAPWIEPCTSRCRFDPSHDHALPAGIQLSQVAHGQDAVAA